jgi:hypothetical protein
MSDGNSADGSKNSPGVNEENVCPYCNKRFKGVMGLQYHVNKFVCRPEQRAVSPSRPRSTRVASVKQEASSDSDDGNEEKSSHSADDIECDDGAVSEDEKSDSDDTERTPKRKRGRPRSNAPVCPHCSKRFKVLMGLQYHLKNFVCRPNERPGKQEAATGNGSIEPVHEWKCSDCQRAFTSSMGLKYHVDKKVCFRKRKSPPDLRRAKKPPPGVVPTHDFATDLIPPGTRYVTPYGVVQVQADHCAGAVPLLDAAAIRQSYNQFSDSRVKREVLMQRQYAALNCEHVNHRRHLTTLHYSPPPGEIDLVSSIDLSGIKAEDDSTRAIAQSQRWPPQICPAPYRKSDLLASFGESDDPRFPAVTLPDRIVECILIQDDRLHFLGVDDGVVREQPHVSEHPTRLYLRRRVLQDIYWNEADVYHCLHCGKTFYSRNACRSHEKALKCRRDKGKFRSLRESLQMLTEQHLHQNSGGRGLLDAIGHAKGVDPLVATRDDRGMFASSWSTAEAKRTHLFAVSDRPMAKYRHAQFASMYPSVILALGFKLVAKVNIASDEVLPVHNNSRRRRREELEIDNEAPSLAPLSLAGSVVSAPPPAKPRFPRPYESDIDQLLREAREEHFREKGLIIGSVYPSVYKALDFKFEKYDFEDDGVQETAQDDGEPAVDDQVTSGGPLLVDVPILIAEVDRGRYPTMKRRSPHDGSKRDTHCSMCRAGLKENDDPSDPSRKKKKRQKIDSLLACNFCARVVHYECMLSRFTIPYPEAHDDFMCHYCIQTVMTRRIRAERRRVKKEFGIEMSEHGAFIRVEDGTHLSAPEAISTIGVSVLLEGRGSAAYTAATKASQEEYVKLLQGIVPTDPDGMRLAQCAAAQTEEMRDIVMLLKDADKRLRQEMVIQQANDLRRQLML